MSASGKWSIEMAKKLALKSFRLKNFKAIQDSGVVKFTPLTVLIGDNGSGKSSLVEGLQTYQRIVTDKLDPAMGLWRGFEYATNPPSEYDGFPTEQSPKVNPIKFELSGFVDSSIYNTTKSSNYKTVMKVNRKPSGDLIFIEKEVVYYKGRKVLERHSDGILQIINEKLQMGVPPDRAIISDTGVYYYAETFTKDDERFDVLRMTEIDFGWQFLTLNPWLMGNPRAKQRTGRAVRLESNGANIAEYLLDIRTFDEDAFEGIIETLQFVLPYARDLQPRLTSELERAVYLQMSEQDFKVPGWMLSTGTLRILCLLALFRHPKPPPLIIIEEIENGLDPRTIHLIVEELRYLVESGRSQVIVTTHSPYLLDLLPLWSIIVVERTEDKGPIFSRPDDDPALENWAEKFGPGKLYTMGNLNRQKTV